MREGAVEAGEAMFQDRPIHLRIECGEDFIQGLGRGLAEIDEVGGLGNKVFFFPGLAHLLLLFQSLLFKRPSAPLYCNPRAKIFGHRNKGIKPR